ncbi:MAG TPA: hypothetical protein VGC67_16905 [Cellulomonas sp.]
MDALILRGISSVDDVDELKEIFEGRDALMDLGGLLHQLVRKGSLRLEVWIRGATRSCIERTATLTLSDGTTGELATGAAVARAATALRESMFRPGSGT